MSLENKQGNPVEQEIVETSVEEFYDLIGEMMEDISPDSLNKKKEEIKQESKDLVNQAELGLSEEDLKNPELEEKKAEIEQELDQTAEDLIAEMLAVHNDHQEESAEKDVTAPPAPPGSARPPPGSRECPATVRPRPRHSTR